mgnify:CR=1 FL=1
MRPLGKAWMIFDATVAEQYQAWPHFISTAPSIGYAYLDDYKRSRPDIFHCPDTLGALADSAGLPRAGSAAAAAGSIASIAGRVRA